MSSGCESWPPASALLHVGRGQRVAVGPVGRVEHHAGRVEPLQRQLVDRLRGLAARSSSCSARARRRGSSCACPKRVKVSTAQPSPSRSRSRGTPSIASIACAAPSSCATYVDVGPQRLGKLGRTGLDRSGKVDKSHGRKPSHNSRTAHSSRWSAFYGNSPEKDDQRRKGEGRNATRGAAKRATSTRPLRGTGHVGSGVWRGAYLRGFSRSIPLVEIRHPYGAKSRPAERRTTEPNEEAR